MVVLHIYSHTKMQSWCRQKHINDILNGEGGHSFDLLRLPNLPLNSQTSKHNNVTGELQVICYYDTFIVNKASSIP